ncbi:hypothetical protein [Ligilactobacillus salivarius]|uniref:hypothetical protein n=1 Tax=Ligilactobacillus salivarius TaxID=1624 RepID=UPI001F50A756|nr:hypothetical protein [Ligilactobacillus salivarius]
MDNILREELKQDTRDFFYGKNFTEGMIDAITDYAIKFGHYPPFGFYNPKVEELQECIKKIKLMVSYLQIFQMLLFSKAFTIKIVGAFLFWKKF